MPISPSGCIVAGLLFTFTSSRLLVLALESVFFEQLSLLLSSLLSSFGEEPLEGGEEGAAVSMPLEEGVVNGSCDKEGLLADEAGVCDAALVVGSVLLFSDWTSLSRFGDVRRRSPSEPADMFKVYSPDLHVK